MVLKNYFNIWFLILSFCIVESMMARAQANMKGSWLPNSNTNSEDRSTADINLFLKSLQGRIRPMVCNYNDDVLKSYVVFSEEEAQCKSSSWICDIQKDKVSVDAMDVNI